MAAHNSRRLSGSAPPPSANGRIDRSAADAGSRTGARCLGPRSSNPITLPHTCRLIAAGMAWPRARGLRGRGLTLRNTFRFWRRRAISGGCCGRLRCRSRCGVPPGRLLRRRRSDRRAGPFCRHGAAALGVRVHLRRSCDARRHGVPRRRYGVRPRWYLRRRSFVDAAGTGRLPMRRPRGGRGPVDPTGALGRISRMTDKTVADRHRRYTGAERTHPGRGARPISAPPQKLPQRQVRVDVRQQPLELLQPLPAIVVDRRLELPSSRAERPYPVGRATKSAGPNEAR